ncbi:MAG: deoxycytidine deaminase [Candidatus Moranbacteria bacterium]|nr:deoxycytidine deaminase [Candidatus Moranbacteria bacterium]
MILTGKKIIEEVRAGNIFIYPFDENQINPNSYNYRLGKTLKIFDYFDGEKSVFKEIEIPEDGFVLELGKMYLGHTKEVIGSSKYAMSLIGRSSMGRLGLFLQVSANLGHTTSKHKWTLELVAAKAIRLYPGMKIGQVSFWKNFGDVEKYSGKYGFLNYPQESYSPITSKI